MIANYLIHTYKYVYIKKMDSYNTKIFIYLLLIVYYVQALWCQHQGL